jgi:hypothetical protein
VVSPVEAMVQERSGQLAPQPAFRLPGGNLNIPTRLRQVDPNIGAAIKPAQAAMHNPGSDLFIFDEDETEIPSFIRKQAN